MQVPLMNPDKHQDLVIQQGMPIATATKRAWKDITQPPPALNSTAATIHTTKKDWVNVDEAKWDEQRVMLDGMTGCQMVQYVKDGGQIGPATFAT